MGNSQSILGDSDSEEDEFEHEGEERPLRLRQASDSADSELRRHQSVGVVEEESSAGARILESDAVDGHLQHSREEPNPLQNPNHTLDSSNEPTNQSLHEAQQAAYRQQTQAIPREAGETLTITGPGGTQTLVAIRSGDSTIMAFTEEVEAAFVVTPKVETQSPRTLQEVASPTSHASRGVIRQHSRQNSIASVNSMHGHSHAPPATQPAGITSLSSPLSIIRQTLGQTDSPLSPRSVDLTDVVMPGVEGKQREAAAERLNEETEGSRYDGARKTNEDKGGSERFETVGSLVAGSGVGHGTKDHFRVQSHPPSYLQKHYESHHESHHENQYSGLPVNVQQEPETPALHISETPVEPMAQTQQLETSPQQAVPRHHTVPHQRAVPHQHRTLSGATEYTSKEYDGRSPERLLVEKAEKAGLSQEELRAEFVLPGGGRLGLQPVGTEAQVLTAATAGVGSEAQVAAATSEEAAERARWDAWQQQMRAAEIRELSEEESRELRRMFPPDDPVVDMDIEFYIIRHGEAAHNVSTLIGGRSFAAPLTPKGMQQARVLGKFLRNFYGMQFDSIYSSPIARARDTARIVCEELCHSPADIILADELQELSQGRWEAQQRAAVYHPGLLQHMTAAQPDFRAPGGESQRQVEFRMVEFLNRVAMSCQVYPTTEADPSEKTPDNGFELTAIEAQKGRGTSAVGFMQEGVENSADEDCESESEEVGEDAEEGESGEFAETDDEFYSPSHSPSRQSSSSSTAGRRKSSRLYAREAKEQEHSSGDTRGREVVRRSVNSSNRIERTGNLASALDIAPRHRSPVVETSPLLSRKEVSDSQGFASQTSKPNPFRVAIFSHGTAIKCLLKGILSSNPQMTHKIEVDNTSVSILKFNTKKGWFLVKTNDTSHLLFAKGPLFSDAR